MSDTELYYKLKEAYTGNNLNNITANIIDLYKTKQFSSIRQISKIVSEFVDVNDKNISKCFSKLVMTYHPDKEVFYNNEIDRLFHSHNFERLNQYAHIFIIGDLENLPISAEDLEDIDYSPEYVWDYEKDGVEYSSETEEDENEDIDYDQVDYFSEEMSFFNAVKRKVYGSARVDLPTYYLEDFEDIEMAEYEIDSLEGVEYCIHVTQLDLSKNQITDLSNLWTLQKLEELYLADNQIGDIDALANLLNLKVIDLSNNFIDDITPLFELENLEYVNLAGNKIPKSQLETLKKMGPVVVT